MDPFGGNMCGNFEVKATIKKVQKRFGLKLTPPIAHGPEMRPTDRILTIDGLSGQARGRLLGWGLRVAWDSKPLINARAESLIEKPTFRPLLQTRCLIPASAYFEWQRPEGGAKQKMRIRPKGLAGDEPFAMAGLIGPDNDTVTIITCTPAPDIATIHDRMPVILEPGGEMEWLNPKRLFPSVSNLLRPYAHDLDTENVDDHPVLF